MAKSEATNASVELKKPKHRSPNHPLLGLEKAIEQATKIQQTYGAHEVPVKLAHKLFGYKEGGGIGDQCVAALKAYGLLRVTGKGDSRKVALTEAGSRIARNAPDRQALIRNAATAPAVHREVMEHYGAAGLPVDALLRQYLVWERPEGQRFNEDSVDAFIERFREALKFSGATSSDIIEVPADEGESEGAEDEPPIMAGHFVQWTSGGVDQFPQPLRVIGVSGDWAFLEGKPTGVPMAELTVQDSPAAVGRVAGQPPANPFVAADSLSSSTERGGAFISFPLAGGNVLEIRLKKRVSEKDFERIKALLELSEDSLVEQDE